MSRLVRVCAACQAPDTTSPCVRRRTTLSVRRPQDELLRTQKSRAPAQVGHRPRLRLAGRLVVQEELHDVFGASFQQAAGVQHGALPMDDRTAERGLYSNGLRHLGPKPGQIVRATAVEIVGEVQDDRELRDLRLVELEVIASTAAAVKVRGK
eukprot:5629005-Prymnesium_polylepis.3